MAIRQLPNGTFQVYAYDPARGRKVYIRPKDFDATTPTNERQARNLEREAILHYKRQAKGKGTPARGLTVREYVDEWLEVHHGEGTRRPSLNTLKHNQWAMRAFLDRFGDRAIDGGIQRREALRWAKEYPSRAYVVAALFNDAFDDEECKANPFRNRRNPEPRGRRDISPLTEHEVERLGEIAHSVHGDYGVVCRAWLMFGAWVGARPGEYFGLDWDALDFDQGLVTITRIKGRKQTDQVVLPKRARDAILDMPGPRTDRLFSTVRGSRIAKGSSSYYFNPVRSVFLTGLSSARRAELEAEKGAMDLYSLRHHAASQIVANGGDEYDCAFQLGNTAEECRRSYIHDYKARRLDTIRQALEGASVRSLDAARKRRGA
jgi:integrase